MRMSKQGDFPAEQAARVSAEALRRRFDTTGLRESIYAGIRTAAEEGRTYVELRDLMGDGDYSNRALRWLVSDDLERNGYGVAAGVVSWGARTSSRCRE